MRSVVRRVAAIAAGMALASAGVVLTAPPASSGFVGLNIDVHKVVFPNPAPSHGFEIHWSCTTGSPSSGDIGFLNNGALAPGSVSSISRPVGTASVCTFTESIDGEADSAVFGCQENAPNANCDSSNVVSYDGGSSANSVNVTAYNAYTEYFDPLTVSPSPADPGQQVTISGTRCTKEIFGGSVTTGGNVHVTVGLPLPIVLDTTAAGTTGSWSVQFTVPAGTPTGAYSITAICEDPVPYLAASLSVGAPVAPITAAPTTTG